MKEQTNFKFDDFFIYASVLFSYCGYLPHITTYKQDESRLAK
jgi:hypothetical protein